MKLIKYQSSLLQGDPTNDLTSGTLNYRAKSQIKSCFHKFEWTNDMITALGATTTGTITVCTLPAGTIIKNAIYVINISASNITSLVCDLIWSVGNQTIIPPFGLKDVAGTNGCTASDNINTSSFLNNSTVNFNLTSTGGNLDQVLGSSGIIYLETAILP